MDIASEIRAAIEQAAMRMDRSGDAQRGITTSMGTVSPGNPFGGTLDVVQEVQIATGFDGTNTVLPFFTDVSLVGGPDLVAG